MMRLIVLELIKVMKVKVAIVLLLFAKTQETVHRPEVSTESLAVCKGNYRSWVFVFINCGKIDLQQVNESSPQ